MAAADDELGGLLWKDQILKGGDPLPRLEAKYLKHVEVNGEWSAGTSIDEYLASLARAVCDANGGVYLERDGRAWKITFVARSRAGIGPRGGPYIVVVFLLEKDLWVTGFRPG